MGEHAGLRAADPDSVRDFTRAVLRDLEALEAVIGAGMVEEGARRFGVEQEMFLVDAEARALPVADRVLAGLGDRRLTSELARFNLEANLDPLPLAGGFLGALEAQLHDVLRTVEGAVAGHGGSVLLTGILPTLHAGELALHNMSPERRYAQLNEVISAARGGQFTLRIEGVEGLDVTHDSVMLESANTSLQLHVQVGVEEFARYYNIAQLISGPLLAAAANSPVLLGRRLWHETRIALFERAVDERSAAQRTRDEPTRVSFGEGWVRDALDLFRENAVRHRVLVVADVEGDPLESVADGVAPALPALLLHNGTVWRWNRPCYGAVDGVAHLRIENRVLPSGPTVADEVANAALFYGLMTELGATLGDPARDIAFSDVKENFLRAAQHGLGAGFRWPGDRHLPARALLLDELLPAARRGLERLGTPAADVENHLAVVEERVRSGRTGATWLLDAISRSERGVTRDLCLQAATQEMIENQRRGEPVHRWRPAKVTRTLAVPAERLRVRDVMTTDLFTVRPDDVLDLATSVMRWKHVRHVPVEDASGRLVGLLTHRDLVRAGGGGASPAVADVMDASPAVCDPDTPLLVAARALLESGRGCVLVVAEARLAGIVTEHDLLDLSMRTLGLDTRGSEKSR